MCGICGIYNYRDGRPVDAQLVHDMTTALRRRGPDDEGILIDGPVALGMRRLSIIDIEGGAQPMRSASGAVVVCNGEIYNYRELRSQLESLGHRFTTKSDTETVVCGYDQWGAGVLPRLNGMFGLAILSADRQSLTIARDPFGVKPLYYRDDGWSFSFASEIKSLLLAPDIEREVDADALESFLMLTFVPSPATALRGIRKLAPGQALVCTPAGCRLTRYDTVTPTVVSGVGESVLVDELRVRIEAAVRRQMVADVPVGALLSGGVDSTAVTTLMSTMTERPIDTFTVGFRGADRLDELGFARQTAARLGTNHHEVVVSSDEYIDYLPRSVWHLEDLVATDSTLAYHKVCELARETVKVVLGGQGADEPFAGYPRHLGERYGRYYRGVPAALRSQVVAPLIEALPRNERLKRAVRSLGDPDSARRMAAVWTILDERERAELFAPDRRPEGGQLLGFAPDWRREVDHLDALNGMLYCDTRFSLADNLLLYGDKISMAVSLEARVPFLDHELVRFVETLPARHKIRGLRRKYLLRRAVRRWIPEEVLQRRKIAFQSPLDSWLRGDLSSRAAEIILDRGSGCREWFSPAVIKRLLDDHVRGRQDNKRILLSLVVFSLWHAQYISSSSADFRRQVLS